MVLPVLREENLAKILEENDKKFVMQPCQVGERRKVEIFFEKDVLKQSKNCFKKPEIRCSIDWKTGSIDRKTGSINQTRQRLTEILKQDRLDQSKFWKEQLLREKTRFFENLPQSIEYNKTNAWVSDEMLSQNTRFNPNFPKI